MGSSTTRQYFRCVKALQLNPSPQSASSPSTNIVLEQNKKINKRNPARQCQTKNAKRDKLDEKNIFCQCHRITHRITGRDPGRVHGGCKCSTINLNCQNAGIQQRTSGDDLQNKTTSVERRSVTFCNYILIIIDTCNIIKTGQKY